jgi:hypothetical protein
MFKRKAAQLSTQDIVTVEDVSTAISNIPESPPSETINQTISRLKPATRILLKYIQQCMEPTFRDTFTDKLLILGNFYY